MARLKFAALVAVLTGLALCGPAAAQVQRTFVASYGLDANTAYNCTFVNPCRTFAAAQTITVDNGEVVALDGAGFAQISITKSISLVASPGFYAGITAASGIGVNIPTAGVKVVLRGLNINGQGTGSDGIRMTAGVSLTVENCVISGFGGNGIKVSSAGAKVRITNTIVRGNGGVSAGSGIYLEQGDLDLSSSKIYDNYWVGVFVYPKTAQSASAVVSDTVSSGNQWGFGSTTNGDATSAKMALMRVTASGNFYSGAQAETGGVLSIGYSNVSNNGYGLYNLSATLETMNNNLVRGNGTNVTSVTGIAGSGFSPGPITNVMPQ